MLVLNECGTQIQVYAAPSSFRENERKCLKIEGVFVLLSPHKQRVVCAAATYQTCYA